MACLSSSSDGWTVAENKVFEDTLAEFQGIGPACMAVLAERLPSKTEAEIRDHYIELLVDIESIEKGTYPEPKYTDSEEEHKEKGLEDEDVDAEEMGWMPEEVKPLSPVIPELIPRLIDMPSPLILDDEDASLNMYSPMTINAAKDELAAIVNGTALAASLIPRALAHGNGLRAAGVPLVGAGSNVSPPLPPAPLSTQPRRGSGRRFRDVSPPTKGVPWTKDEHRMFLIGMDVYGRGDWRSISKNFVQTRTPSQIASHAQKYFNRLAEKRERRRPSIHDITSASESSFALKLPASVYDIIKRNKLLFSPITNNAHQPAGPSLSSPSCSNRFPAIEFVPSANPNAMAEGNRAESFAPTQLPNSFREKTGHGNYSFAKDAAGLPYDPKGPGPWWA